MKLPTSLLQAITVGVTVSTAVVTMSSCEKIKQDKDQIEDSRNGQTDDHQTTNPESCPACGMG